MRRILVIDDEPVVRDMIALMLRDSGWHVVCAECGHAAVSAIAAFAFDLVIVDIFMPGMTGLETIKILHEDAPDVPIIAISGHAGPKSDVVSAAYICGASYFLHKPFTRAELNTAIVNCQATAMVA